MSAGGREKARELLKDLEMAGVIKTSKSILLERVSQNEEIWRRTMLTRGL